MHTDPLLQILILLAASVFVVTAVRKLALPAILGYLAVGMLLGPARAGTDRSTTRPLACSPISAWYSWCSRSAWNSRCRACSPCAARCSASAAAQVLRDHGARRRRGGGCFGLAPAAAVVVGGAVAMSSTAIIIAQLTEQSENTRTHGRLAVAICLFQDLSFPVVLGLLSPLAPRARHAGRTPSRAIAIAAARCCSCSRPGAGCCVRCSSLIAAVRSAELFSLAVLLAVLASAWATHAAGLSLALGAFLAGMMLAETEFRHQIEATIRSYRDVLLGLFFITLGMLLDLPLLLRHPAARDRDARRACSMLKAAVVARGAKPATHSWFKSLRTGWS